MKLFPLLFTLLLASLVWSAECKTYFSDSFTLRVLDAKNRPIEGASVYYSYQYSTTFGNEYISSKEFITDSNGIITGAANNQEPLESKLDCKIKANATAGGSFAKTEFVANSHASIVDIFLTDVYRVVFRITDKVGAPIEGATITVGNSIKKTDAGGAAIMNLKKATGYEYLVNYKDGKTSSKFNVADDEVVQITFEENSIRLYVLDDSENPLNATLTILNETFILEQGYFEKNKTLGSDIRYTVSYGGVKKSGTIIPSVNNTARIYYDLHAPGIEKPTTKEQNKILTMSFGISDVGTRPSGVNSSSIKVIYTTNPQGELSDWADATVYTIGKDTYSADFTALPPNKLVAFRIETRDNEGNKATLEGNVLSGQTPANTTVNNVSNTGNSSNNNGNTQNNNQEIPLLHIIGGIIIIILIVYLVNYLKNRSKEGE